MTAPGEFRVRLPELADKAGLLHALATACRFDESFGYNWDALWDALSDWLETRTLPLTLVLDGTGVVQTCREDWLVCLDILHGLRLQWPGFDYRLHNWQPLQLLILDRDGVINQDSDAYIKSVDEWQPLPGSIEAMTRLYHAGYTLAVATNQSGLARNYFDEATLHAMHDKLRSLLAAQGAECGQIAWCPHGPDDGCECRKPLPGLLQQISHYYGQPLNGVWMVGDSLRDLQAGVALGAQPVLVRTGKGEHTARKPLPEGTLVFDNLQAVADQLLTGC